MPYSDGDFQKVCIATLVPGAAGVVAYGFFHADKDENLKYWKDLKKPNWAPKSVKIYAAVDSLVSLPLGCASYLVYKEGGFDFPDTKKALTCYGVMIGLNVLAVPLMLKLKNTNVTAGASAVISALAATTAKLFYDVNPKAGLMLVPLAAWAGFYTVLMTAIAVEEGKSSNKD